MLVEVVKNFMLIKRKQWTFFILLFTASLFCTETSLFAGSSKSSIKHENSGDRDARSLKKREKTYRKLITLALAGKDGPALTLCEQYLSDTSSHDERSKGENALELLKSKDTRGQERQRQEVLAIAGLIESRQGRFEKSVEYFSDLEHDDLIALHLNQVITTSMLWQEKAGKAVAKKAWYQVMLLSQRLMRSEAAENQVLGNYGLLLARLNSECEMSASCPLPQDYDSSDPCILTISGRRELTGDLIRHITSILYSKESLAQDLRRSVLRLEHSPSMQVAWQSAGKEGGLQSIADTIHNYFEFRALLHLVTEAGALAKADLPGEFPIHDIFVWNFIEHYYRLQEGKEGAHTQLIELLQHTKEPYLQSLILYAVLVKKTPSLTEHGHLFNEQERDLDLSVEHYVTLGTHLDSISDSSRDIPTQWSLSTLQQFVKRAQSLQSDDEELLSLLRSLQEKALQKLIQISQPLSSVYRDLRYEALSSLMDLLWGKSTVSAQNFDPLVKILASEFPKSTILESALAQQAQLFIKEENQERALENYRYLLSLSPKSSMTALYQAHCGLLQYQMSQLTESWGYLDKALEKGSLQQLALDHPDKYLPLYRNAWRAMIETNFSLMDDPTSRQSQKKRLKNCFSRFLKESLIANEEKALWLLIPPLQQLRRSVDDPQSFQVALQSQDVWHQSFLEYAKKETLDTSIYRGFAAVKDLIDPFYGSGWQKKMESDEGYFLSLSYAWSGLNDSSYTDGREEYNWIGDLIQTPLAQEEKDIYLRLLEGVLGQWEEYSLLCDEMRYARLFMEEQSLTSTSEFLASKMSIRDTRALLLRLTTRLQKQIDLAAAQVGAHLPRQLEALLMDPLIGPSWQIQLPTIEERFLLERIALLSERAARADRQILSTMDKAEEKQHVQNRYKANRFLRSRVCFYQGEFSKAQDILLQLRSEQLEVLKTSSTFIGQEELMSYTLYLAIAQELSENQLHESFETYQHLLDGLRSTQEPGAWAGLQLHTARIGVASLLPFPLWSRDEEPRSFAIETSPKVRQILDLYNLLIEVRQVETEPLHLEAAIEAAFFRSFVKEAESVNLLSALREVRKLFSQEFDVQSLEYYQQLQNDPKKRDLHEVYLLLIDAMMIQVELEEMGGSAPHSRLDTRSHALLSLAHSLYQNILAHDRSPTPFLEAYAQHWLQRLDQRFLSQEAQ